MAAPWSCASRHACCASFHATPSSTCRANLPIDLGQTAAARPGYRGTMRQEHGATHRKAFRAIARLRELRTLEREHFAGVETAEDRDLLYEIGWRQAQRQPLTVKQALVMHLGSLATVQRRLRALRRL